MRLKVNYKKDDLAYASNMGILKVNWTTPMNIDVLGELDTTNKFLLVPTGTVAAYKASPVWGKFGDNISDSRVVMCFEGGENITPTGNILKCWYHDGEKSEPFTGDIETSTVDVWCLSAEDMTSIPDEAFVWYGNETIPVALKKIIIPNSVTSIGARAFKDCYALESIDIPNSVTSIGQEAFGGCDTLESITIPDSVTSISNFCFASCDALETVTIPNSVTTIGSEAFNGCQSLNSIDIPDSVTSIGDDAFGYCSLSSIVLPDSIEYIGAYAFEFDYNLSSVVVNATVPPVIGSEVFLETSDDLKIYVPSESVAAYKEAWSDYEDKIYAIPVIPTSGVINGPSAISASGQFAYTVEYDGTTDGMTVRWSTNKDYAVILSSGNDYCNIDVTSAYSISDTFTINGIVTCADGTSFTISKQVNVSIVGQPDDEIWYTSVSGNVINMTDASLIAQMLGITAEWGCPEVISNTYSDGKGVIKFASPLTWIGASFEDNKVVYGPLFLNGDEFGLECDLETISLPATIEEIKIPEIEGIGIVSPFFGNGNTLQEIKLGISLTNIPDNAFVHLRSLSNITIPNSVTSIGGAAFYECSGLTSVTIPNSVTSIRDNAFHGCGALEDITCLATIPPSTTPNSFSSTGNCPIYVPVESVDAYKAADGWSSYANRIYSIEE